ncbi:PAS domain S-box protein [Ammoniphilus sp. CFH 90114]|uniref:PAS domain-containing sensor histidine kinase n=1 Tax=Ammoniphilus sp. CFH 90114 TaxID=2493665 RepID=UPI0013E99BFE|nr:PAS domain S-box protein [Ammoniphilus sp. CFH 90114]
MEPKRICKLINSSSQSKLIEEELKESEEKYRQLVDIAPDAIVVHHHGNILYVNQAGVTLLGAERAEDILGKSFLDFIHPDDQELTRKRIEQVQHKNQTIGAVQKRLIRLDKQCIHVETTAAPIHYKGVLVTQKIIRDVTERVQTEAIMRDREEKYRLITENMCDLIGILDLNGVIQYASPSHRWVLGYSPEIIMGLSVIDFIHPGDLSYFQKQYDRMIQSKSTSQVEFRCRHDNGNWVVLEAQGNPIIEGSGEVKHIVFVARDITERKRSEELLRKTKNLSIVGELAAGVAHEIRNPLTSIKGFIELLQTGITKPEYFEILSMEMNRLESIIEEFLLLAKPQVVDFKETDVNSILYHVITLLHNQAIIKNIEMLYELASELPPLRCDPNKLKQVFINLVKNAIDAIDDRGRITIQTYLIDADTIRVRIADNGCGISDHRLKFLGEPFYSTKEKGVGLGIMVSYKIIKEHQGTLSFQSEVDQGTIVDVNLPLGSN